MSRVTPYHKKPTNSWKEGIEKLAESTLYLVARSAPIIFSIKDEDNVYKVILGNAHSCNCGCKQTDFCIHILFCLTKVLRIPVTDSLSWQRSYTDIEIDAALKKEAEFKAIRIAHRRAQTVATDTADEGPTGEVSSTPGTPSATETDSSGTVKRHLLEGDELDVCPICQDEMVATEDENVTNNQLLTWCRKGCGKNIHAQCMNMLVQYELKKYGSSSSNPTPSVTVECPLCRADFDVEALKEDCRGKLTVKFQCVPVRCHRAATSGCCLGDRMACTNAPISKSGAVIEGDFFRCVECSNSAVMKGNKPVDFCHKCFNSQTTFTMIHTEHHFINSNGSTQDIRDIQWVPLINPFCNSSKNAAVIRTLHNRSAGSNESARRSEIRARMSAGASGNGTPTHIAANEDGVPVAADIAAAIEDIVNSREITPNDYDLLLRLGENPGSTIANSDIVIPDICEHLISSLPVSGKNDPGLSPSSSLGKLYIASPKQFSECWCCSSGSVGQVSAAPPSSNSLLTAVSVGEDIIDGKGELKTLVCGHVAHSSCIKAVMDGVMNQGDTEMPAFWKLYSAMCRHCDCAKLLFPCLSRRKFKSIKVSRDKPPTAELCNTGSSHGQGGFGSSSSRSRIHPSPLVTNQGSQQVGQMELAGIALCGHTRGDETTGTSAGGIALRGSGSRKALGSMSAGSSSRSRPDLSSDMTLGGVAVAISDSITIVSNREEGERLSRNPSGTLPASSSRKAPVALQGNTTVRVAVGDNSGDGTDNDHDNSSGMDLGGVSLPQLANPQRLQQPRGMSKSQSSNSDSNRGRRGPKFPKLGLVSGSQSVRKPKQYADALQPEGNMSLSLLVNGSTKVGAVGIADTNILELSHPYRNPLGKSGPHYSFKRNPAKPDSDGINLVGATVGGSITDQLVREPDGTAPPRLGKRIRSFPSKRLKEARKPDIMLNVTPSITYVGSADGEGGGDVLPYEVNSSDARTIHVKNRSVRGRAMVPTRPTIPAHHDGAVDLSVS